MAISSQVTQQAPGVWLATADTQRYQQVEQRVVGQLLQTLLYENVLAYQHSPLAGSQYRFVVSGSMPGNNRWSTVAPVCSAPVSN